MAKQSLNRLVLIISVLITGLVFPSSAFANDYRKAVEATTAGNYELAISIWKKLAKQGNPVAQYNLAIFYKEGYGVDSDSSESRRWYKAAAQQRLVQATTSIKPADDNTELSSISNGSKTHSDNDPVGWVLNQNPRHYTLQLASSRSERRIRQYYEENQMQGKGGYYKKQQDGETWYFLIYGAFNSSRNASNEIQQLPEEIRKWSPWVRRLGNIQKVIKRNDV